MASALLAGITSFCPNSRETIYSISSWKEGQIHIVRECWMEDIVVLLSFKKILSATEVNVEYRTQHIALFLI